MTKYYVLWDTEEEMIVSNIHYTENGEAVSGKIHFDHDVPRRVYENGEVYEPTSTLLVFGTLCIENDIKTTKIKCNKVSNNNYPNDTVWEFEGVII